MLAWGEKHKQGELRADEALAGAWCAGHDQVGHGVGCGVNPSQTAATAPTATCPTCTSLQSDTNNELSFNIYIYLLIRI